MGSVQRVLVGIDFSEGADLGVLRALRIAHQHGAKLHAVHVVETLPIEGILNPALGHREEIENALAARLKKIVDESGLSFPAANLSSELRIGRPVEEMLGAAEDFDADVTVVGYRGKGLLARTLLGSVAAALVRQSTRPLMVARDWGDDAPKRVLAAVDLDADSKDVLQTAANWAKRANAELHVLYAWEIAGLADYHTAMPNIPARDLDMEVMDDSRKRLESIVNEALGEGHGASLHVRPGTAAYEVVFAAERDKYSLVVIGSHGRRGFSKFLLGNTAERVIERAPCSVLVLRVGQTEA